MLLLLLLLLYKRGVFSDPRCIAYRYIWYIIIILVFIYLLLLLLNWPIVVLAINRRTSIKRSQTRCLCLYFRLWYPEKLTNFGLLLTDQLMMKMNYRNLKKNTKHGYFWRIYKFVIENAYFCLVVISTLVGWSTKTNKTSQLGSRILIFVITLLN